MNIINPLEKKKKISFDINKNIKVRRINGKDVSKRYVEWLNDFEVVKYTEQKFKNHTEESTAAFVEEKFNSNNDLLLGIFFKNFHIGNIKLGPINWQTLEANISFILGEKKFWNKGIITITLLKTINYAFKKFNLKEINAGYYEDNVASAKVFQKCNFIIRKEKIKTLENSNQTVKVVLVSKKNNAIQF